MADSDSLKAALLRLIAGNATDAELEMVQQALQNNQITLATNERAVAVGGNVSDTVIVTGDGNVVLVIQGQQAETLRSVIEQTRIPIFVDLPELPVRYVDRPTERANLRTVLQEQTNVGLVAALLGQGGIGKTYLATLLCYDPEIRRLFPDGVLWATLGQNIDENIVKAIQQRWLTKLGANTASVTTLSDGKERLKQQLEGRTMLLIIDDVWNKALAHWLRCSSSTVRVLMTTRDISQIPDAYHYRLDVLSREQSYALLMQVSDGRITETEVDEIAELVGDLPLGLSVLGGLMADEFVTWSALKAEFQKNLLVDFPDEFNRLIYASLRTSIDALGDMKQRYLELAIFPNKVRLEPGVIIRYWSQTAGLSEFAAQWLLSSMVKKSLIQKNNMLHDLPYTYLQYVTTHDKRTDQHNALIATYGAPDAWGDLPDNENGYGWTYLAWHLHQAERTEDLRSLLLNASYLQHKIERMKSASLAGDLAFLSNENNISLLAQTIDLSRHILDKNPNELPNQIRGRTGDTVYSLVHDWPAWPEPHFRLDSPTLAQAGGDLLRIMPHQKAVTHCTFSPDGKYVLSASWDKTLRLWDVQTGELLHSLRGHSKGVTACMFSLDGKYVLSASWDKTLRLWDVQTGELLHTFRGHRHCVNACSISRDGRHALSADGRMLRLWNMQTGKLLHTFRGHKGHVSACTFSPDGRYVLSASDQRYETDCTLRLWDVQTGRLLHTFQDRDQDNKSTMDACALSPDGKYVLGANGRMLQLWDVQTGRLLHTFQVYAGPVKACTFSPDGRYVLSAWYDRTLRLWDVQTGKLLHIFRGHIADVNACVFSPDGRYVLSASGSYDISDDNTLRLWNIQREVSLQTYQGHTKPVIACSINRDGRHALSTSFDGTLRLWNVQTGECLHTFQELTRGVNACAFSPDGRYALSTDRYTLRLWDVQTGKFLHAFQGHTEGLNACTFSPDGRYMLSASYDKTMRLWDVASGKSLRIFAQHGSYCDRYCKNEPLADLNQKSLVSVSSRLPPAWQKKELAL